MSPQEDAERTQAAPSTDNLERRATTNGDANVVPYIQETVAAIESEVTHSELTQLLRDASAALNNSPLDPGLLNPLATTPEAVRRELLNLAQIVENNPDNPDEIVGKPLDLLQQPDSILAKLSPLAKLALREWVYSKTICEAIAETHYGVLRHDAWKRKTFHRIKKEGQTGVVIQGDLQGLNAINKYDVLLGDAALLATADFFRSVLIHFNLDPNDKSLIGRKGDEFYIFLPGISLSEARTAIHALYKAWNDGSRNIPIGNDVRKINLYIETAAITQAEQLTPLLAQMENAIEAKKVTAILRYIQELEKLFDPAHSDSQLFANWFNLFKENPVDVRNETDMQKIIPKAAAAIRRYNLPLRCAVTLLDQKRTPRAMIALFSRALLQEAAIDRKQVGSSIPSERGILSRIRQRFQGSWQAAATLPQSADINQEMIDRVYAQMQRVLDDFTDPDYASLPAELHDILMQKASEYDLE